MLRTITLAIVAAASLASAAQAQEIRVAVAGKSAQQLHADIVSAARSVCRKATAQETFVLDAMSRCTAQTVKSTLAQLGDPTVAQLEATRLAQR